MPKKGRFKYSINFIDAALQRAFYSVGYQVGLTPWYFVAAPLICVLILATGFLNFNEEKNPEYLFSPTDAPSRDERALIERFFPMNFTGGFDPGRVTREICYAQIIVEAHEHLSIVSKNVLREIVMLDNLVKKLSVATRGGRLQNYETLCGRRDKECFANTFLLLYSSIDEIERNETLLSYPVAFDPHSGDPIFFPVFFGAVNVSADGFLRDVRAARLLYFLKSGPDDKDQAGVRWEQAFLEVMSGLRLNYSNLTYMASSTIEQEVDKNTKIVFRYVPLSIIGMLLFLFASSSGRDWVKNKPWVGTLGLFTVGLSIVGVIGLMLLLGVKFIGLNAALVFLLLGIGMDDTYVIMSAWQKTKISESVPERMARTYSEAAVAITITSITNAVCFYLGMMTPLEGMRIFCLYTGTGVVLTYLFQITFFGGFVAIFGHLERKNRHGLFLWCTATPKSLAVGRNWLYRALWTGGINSMDPLNKLDNKEPISTIVLRDYIGSLLSKCWVKTVVLLLFAVYLAFAVWGVGLVNVGFDKRRAPPDGSYAIDFLDAHYKYFNNLTYRINVVVADENLSYSDIRTQTDILDMLAEMEQSRYGVNEKWFSEVWLRSFLEHIDDVAANQGKDVTLNEAQFVKMLKEEFLPGSQFENDVVFDCTGSRIVATRYVIQMANVMTSQEETDMMVTLRQIGARSGLDVTVYHPLFMFFDQYLMIQPYTVKCVLTAAILMVFFSLAFIPNAFSCIWVGFAILSIEVGVVGYMTFWDVNLDGISMIAIIMCVGFSVDYAAHISYAFMTADVVSTDDRIRAALANLGMPVFQSACSTIIAILPLAFVPSYIFKTFFKTVFLVTALGATNALIVLPVLLSIFGGANNCNTRQGWDDGDVSNDVTRIMLSPTKENDIVVVRYKPEGDRTNGSTNGAMSA